METIDQIRQRIKSSKQETAEELKVKAIFKNGMELPEIQPFPVIDGVSPHVNDNFCAVLECPNKDCNHPTQHLHRGTIVEDELDIYIPFTCEYCEFTYVLQFLHKQGTCYVTWNNRIL